jgi:hypothetical protein
MNNAMDLNSECCIIHAAADTTNEASDDSPSLLDVSCKIYISLTKATRNHMNRIKIHLCKH